jgi:hypothetical protein
MIPCGSTQSEQIRSIIPKRLNELNETQKNLTAIISLIIFN